MDHGKTSRTFVSPQAKIEYLGSLEKVPRRLPGAMAALHQSRARSRLPRTTRLRADDGKYAPALEFTARSALQVITADPIAGGYGFIHEAAGEFAYELKAARNSGAGCGLGILEYVD